MLSVLIPTFRYDCSPLARTVALQCRALREKLGRESFDFEVIVSDDCSGANWAQRIGKALSDIPECRVLPQTRNLGRAANCNALFRAAQFRWQLLMDCDTMPCTDTYIAEFWERREDAPVVCGKLVNPNISPRGHELRYRYEKAAEPKRTASYRQQHPYEAFTTFSILFDRNLCGDMRFDERCTEYGYEDALLGLELSRRRISVLHTDTPLLHLGIDSNEEFLGKTETAMRTLSRLGEPMQSAAGASRICRKLGRLGLLPVLRVAFRCARPLLRCNLLGRRPSVFLFNIYKLGYYATLPADRRA